MRFQGQIVESNNESLAGITYKIGDGEVVTATLAPSQSSSGKATGPTLSPLGNSPVAQHFLGYEFDPNDSNNGNVPANLDQTSSYLIGLNNDLLFEGFTNAGISLPPGFAGVDGEIVLTLYPSSKLSVTSIGFDIFDLIIDPSSYTSADLQYFADRGVTPATKNVDGSYTLKSQLTIPSMG